MQAVVLEKPNELIFRANYKDPIPADDEVLIEVHFAAICGSDIRRIVKGEAHIFPIIPGHEIIGEVISCGNCVSKDWIGKRVVVVPLIPCMKCDQCNSGFFSSCPNYSFIGSRRNGGFAEMISVPASNILEISHEGNPIKQVLIEPTTIASHALRRGGLKENQSIGILGCGSIGLLIFRLAKWRRGSYVFAFDIDDSKLFFAKKIGADFTRNILKDPIESNQLSNEDVLNCVDICFETAGQIQSLINALSLTKPGGRIVCIGNLPTGQNLPSEIIEIILRKELTIMGSWMSYSKPFPGINWNESIKYLKEDKSCVEEIISEQVNLKNLPEFFYEISMGKTDFRKVVVNLR